MKQNLLFKTLKKEAAKSLVMALMLLFAGYTKAQVTPPFWDIAWGTCGGFYQNGGGVKAGWDGNVYMTYRYSGTINLGVPGFTASPANGIGTSIGTGKLNSALHGLWGTEVQASGGYDYILGTGLDADLNSYAGGIISSGAGWYCGKNDVNGVFQWDIQCHGAGGYASGICTDKNVIPTAKGHTYICGPYNGATMTVLGHSIPAQGVADGFVLRVNSQGLMDSRCWLIALHGTAGNASYPSKCAMDYAGHLWVCGGYSGSPTFGSFTLPASAGSSNYNLYVVEIDTGTGNVLNAFTAVNAGSSSPWAPAATNLGEIVIDSANNMYISGPFMHTATWGSFSATVAGGGPNYYLAKMQPNGVFQWVATNSSPNSEGSGYYLAIDKNWDIVTTGQFSGTATFGTQTINGSASGSICVAKYASGNGALMYALQGGGMSGSQGGAGVAVDGNRQVYVSGTYNNPGATFITAGGPITLPVGVSSSIFLAKLDSTPNMKIIPTPGGPYCAGNCYTLPVTVVGVFNPGNVFTVQLSDSSGSFGSGVTNIGSLAATSSCTINICIPALQIPGTHYQLRVVSNNFNYSSVVRNSYIIINPPCSILPIQLTSFTSECTEGYTLLKWSTATETNNDYFTIQKSQDGMFFETVATVKGAGNSTSVHNYSTIDYSPFPGVSYYRISQTDFDGVTDELKIIANTACEDVGSVNAFTVNSNNIEVQINSPAADSYTITLVNAMGQTILTQVHNVAEGMNEFNLDPQVAKGIYILRITSSTKVSYKKLTLGM